MTLDGRDFASGSGTCYSTINGVTTNGTLDLRLMRYAGVEVGYGHPGAQRFTAEGLNLRGWANPFTDKGGYHANMTEAADQLAVPLGSDGSDCFLKGGTAKVQSERTETITVETIFSTREQVTATSHSTLRPLVGLSFAFPSESNRRFRLELAHVGEIGRPCELGKSSGRPSVTVF